LGVPALKIPAIATHMRARVAQNIQQIRLFEGVDDMLSRLAASEVRIGLVSSNSEANVRAILGADNEAKIHDFGCGASIFGKAHKFRRIIRRSGVPAKATLCIGDETRDIEAAREVDAACAAVTWGYATEEVLAALSPTMIFRTVDEIASRLEAEGTAVGCRP
jgi:phosphoglycolate phosphatase